MNVSVKKNYFITIEGIEGVGKTTSAAYVESLLQDAGIHFVRTREPGGTEIAEKIRELLLMHHQEHMHIDTELLLFFAGRAQHVHQKIKPALDKGDWVLCDRFTDASFAYQCGGRGIPEQRIEQLERWVLGDFRPDITILLHARYHLPLRLLPGIKL
ncbi:unnamed protein product [marine sediment metagenome]|uniref:dTMP kinase n=1 Tax=marine sediment metagenome TaxID=412755 RepID=X1C6V6_9ZZZZ